MASSTVSSGYLTPRSPRTRASQRVDAAGRETTPLPVLPQHPENRVKERPALGMLCDRPTSKVSPLEAAHACAKFGWILGARRRGAFHMCDAAGRSNHELDRLRPYSFVGPARTGQRNHGNGRSPQQGIRGRRHGRLSAADGDRPCRSVAEKEMWADRRLGRLGHHGLLDHRSTLLHLCRQGAARIHPFQTDDFHTDACSPCRVRHLGIGISLPRPRSVSLTATDIAWLRAFCDQVRKLSHVPTQCSECDRIARARSRSSGVSTPSGALLTTTTSMRMPASSARNCSSRSRCSLADGGSLTKRSS